MMRPAANEQRRSSVATFYAHESELGQNLEKVWWERKLIEQVQFFLCIT
jgi:hypothetical protein